MSVTSQILVVDMLQSDIPTKLITGILALHAEKYVCHQLFNYMTNHSANKTQSNSSISRGIHSPPLP